MRGFLIFIAVAVLGIGGLITLRQAWRCARGRSAEQQRQHRQHRGGGDFEPGDNGGSDFGVNSGDEGGDENAGSGGGGGEDGE